jgi:uncharacterized protein (DUF4415 family)
MPRKKSAFAAASPKRRFVDPDDAPEITEAMLDRAEIRVGGKIVQRGRPPMAAPKRPVSLRLDPDVIAHFRRSGRGWQSRINAALRKVAKLPKEARKKA